MYSIYFDGDATIRMDGQNFEISREARFRPELRGSVTHSFENHISSTVLVEIELDAAGRFQVNCGPPAPPARNLLPPDLTPTWDVRREEPVAILKITNHNDGDAYFLTIEGFEAWLTPLEELLYIFFDDRSAGTGQNLSAEVMLDERERSIEVSTNDPYLGVTAGTLLFER